MIFTLCWQIAVWVFGLMPLFWLARSVFLSPSPPRGGGGGGVVSLCSGDWAGGALVLPWRRRFGGEYANPKFFHSELPLKKWWVGRASFSKLREGSSMQISYHINSYYLYIIMSSTPSYHGRTHDSTSTLKKDMSCQTLSNHIVSGAIECSHFIGCCSTYNGCFQIMAIDVIL